MPESPAPPAAVRTVLAFDFGAQRIGVAVGNSLSRDAQALAIISGAADAPRFARIAELIAEWRPAAVVVGRPSHPDGTDLPITPRCEKFARQLHGRFGVPVVMVDERYSSVEAESDYWNADSHSRKAGAAGSKKDPRKLRFDDQAAAIILRQYWAEQGPT